MACEVFATANTITHIGNSCLMILVMIIFLKPNRPENVLSIIQEASPTLMSLLEILSHGLSVQLYNSILGIWGCCLKKQAGHLKVSHELNRGEYLFIYFLL